MPVSRQREWLTDIVEGAPSILFLALWQSDVDIRFTGWAAAALAATVLIGFRLFRVSYNPIMLGVNIHLLIITPLIVTLFYLGANGWGRVLFAFSHRAVLVTIFLVGCTLTVFSRRGFIGIEGLPDPRRLTYSLVLLAASIAAIAWTFTYKGVPVVAIAIPLMALFGVRRLLVARWHDRNDRSEAVLVVGPASALTAGSASEAA